MNRVHFSVAVCILMIISGCSGSQLPEKTSEQQIQPETATVGTTTTATTTSTSVTDQSTSTPNKENNGSVKNPNDSDDYTQQFYNIITNDSARLSQLNNPYEPGRYDRVDINITEVRIREVPPDDQNILIVSQNLENLSTQPLRNSLGKISIAFATVLKREAVYNEGDWNISQVRVLTRYNGSLLFKHRIEYNWAGAWVFQLKDWTTSGYVRGSVGTSSAVHRPNEGTFSSPYAETLESNLEVETIDTNITGVHVNQSGRQVFLTYTTTTPPTDTHLYDHMDEYHLILDEYGKLAADEDFGSRNWTRLSIEEVYETPNGTYDTRRMYTVNSTYAERVYNDEVTRPEIAQYLIDNATLEQDAYYE